MFWAEPGFRGGVLQPLEEINLRYVAITRAETTCSSGQWPAPMFSGLADYVRRHPRFLTLEEATELRTRAASGAVPVDPPVQAAPRSAEPESTAAVDVAALVSAYTKSYPLLRWDLLAERFQQEGGDVGALLRGHPLQSAQRLVAAFVDALAAGGKNKDAVEQEPTPASEVSAAAPEQEPPNPALPDLISAEYGLAPVVMQERFNSSGWSEVGRVQIACPRCATKPMVAFNRPRTTQTFDQWYRQDWALFCTNCALLSEAEDAVRRRLGRRVRATT